MTRIIKDHVKVRVPATSANLGPGYDTLGIALSLYDEVEVVATTGGVEIEVVGQGEGTVPTGENHLVVRALRLGLDHVGASQIGIRMRCVNRIPHGRGLGSSASAIVCGLMLARGLISDPQFLNDKVILDLATEIEGHPDNVAPAIYGGATVSWMGDEGAQAQQLEVAQNLVTTAFIPGFTLSTQAARSLLPAQVPHSDAAFNVARAALLVLALQGKPELMMEATKDRLHQNYREPAMPATLELVRWLRGNALPATVSGAGPTAIVLGPVSGQIKREAAKVGWEPFELNVDRCGATHLG